MFDLIFNLTYLIWPLFFVATPSLSFLLVRWANIYFLRLIWHPFTLLCAHWVWAGYFRMVHGRIFWINVDLFLIFFLRLTRCLLLLRLGRVWHVRLTGRRVEWYLIFSGRGRCALVGWDLTISLIYVLSALILVHLGLLVQHCYILSRCGRDHLLTASQVLDITASFRWLLSLLLQARIVIIFLWDWVLLRILLQDVAVRVMEASLGLHRVVCDVGLGGH